MAARERTRWKPRAPSCSRTSRSAASPRSPPTSPTRAAPRGVRLDRGPRRRPPRARQQRRHATSASRRSTTPKPNSAAAHRDQPVLRVRDVPPTRIRCSRATRSPHRQRRQRLRHDPRAHRLALRHDQGGAAPAHPQPRGANGPKTASASTRSRRGTSARGAPRPSSPIRSISRKCWLRTPMGRIGEPEEVAGRGRVPVPARVVATSPANASRSTAGSCATGSEPRGTAAGGAVS